ncbi:hypothetical protein [Paraburkholderia tagetis]|uniref:Uncharacterized protein n=1 Tax=Paraburkholderia tagetis TaxID=2913261 RepID=A0A9X1ULE2_9BURK|nr:hypothetical protein [Paraburkholderia tagetis]MCG5077534.1 hypothetical protein [Paraburkholderia tagetis]
MRTETRLKELHGIGTFPNDYTRDDLIRYVMTLEGLAYESQGVIATPKARLRELESVSASCRLSS